MTEKLNVGMQSGWFGFQHGIDQGGKKTIGIDATATAARSDGVFEKGFTIHDRMNLSLWGRFRIHFDQS